MSGQELGSSADATWIGRDVPAGIVSEAGGMQGMLDQYLDPATHDQVVQIFGGATLPADFVQEIQLGIQIEQQFANNFQEPDAQFQQWVAQMQAEAASMPMLRNAIGGMESNRTEIEEAEIEYAMLGAGFALAQGNQAQFQSTLDPVTGQPFAVTQTAGGFQLSSSFKTANGKPVTLRFGSLPQN